MTMMHARTAGTAWWSAGQYRPGADESICVPCPGPPTRETCRCRRPRPIHLREKGAPIVTFRLREGWRMGIAIDLLKVAIYVTASFLFFRWLGR